MADGKPPVRDSRAIERLSKVEARVDADYQHLDNRISALSSEVSEGFERLDRKMDAIASKPQDASWRWAIGLVFTVIFSISMMGWQYSEGITRSLREHEALEGHSPTMVKAAITESKLGAIVEMLDLHREAMRELSGVIHSEIETVDKNSVERQRTVRREVDLLQQIDDAKREAIQARMDRLYDGKE